NPGFEGEQESQQNQRSTNTTPAPVLGLRTASYCTENKGTPMYASAQHPYHSCICLFERGVASMTKVSSTPLVQPGSDRLHLSVLRSALGSQVAIVS
ncbi:hypothetical protein, partial [Paracidovorax sp. MALMAid1276]|uniref:hypothetical protein n=1 Tax=Paracidovorax sp. MALMAid1276 TaxID=3411631 RepID=UPI003B9BCF8D